MFAFVHEGVGEAGQGIVYVMQVEKTYNKTYNNNLLLADKDARVLYHNDRDIPLKKKNPTPQRNKKRSFIFCFPPPHLNVYILVRNLHNA